MIVVTSEETGTISIACKGQLIRNLTDSDLREHLVRYLCGTNNEDKAAVKGIRKLFGGLKMKRKISLKISYMITGSSWRFQ